MELFNDFFDPAGAWEMLSRVGHIFAGITWIGLLYYFNFVQTPATPELSDGARSEVVRKIALRALWWFRWGALLTFLFGLSMLAVQDYEDPSYLSGQRGTAIMTGMLLGITMFLNVWGIIWPKQKIIIGSLERVAAGGEADPAAGPAAKPAARASRLNTFFSIPMLFFMVFAAHGAAFFGSGSTGPFPGTVGYWIVVLVIWAFCEGSALGLIGGYDSAFNKLVFDTHQNTIIAGFVMLAVLYFIGWEIILQP